jgi:hypothetical protein
MSQTGLGKGARVGGGQGRQGRVGQTGSDRVGLSRAGLGHIADRNPRHA